MKKIEKLLAVVALNTGKGGGDDESTRGRGAVGMVFGDSQKSLDLDEIQIVVPRGSLTVKAGNTLKLSILKKIPRLRK